MNTNIGGIAEFDYIDFVQNHKLQQNLAEYKEMDAPQDVQDRVKKMAQAMVDPELGTCIASASLAEDTMFDLDPEGDAMNTINAALQDSGWMYSGDDGDGCHFYRRAGVQIKVKVILQ